MNWIVEEKFTAQFDPNNMYRIMPSVGNKYMVLHIKTNIHGMTTTGPIGEYETIKEAVVKAEEHAKELVNAPPTKEEKSYTSEELLGRD